MQNLDNKLLKELAKYAEYLASDSKEPYYSLYSNQPRLEPVTKSVVPTAAAPSTQVRSEVKDAASSALGYNNQAGAGIAQPEGLPTPDSVAQNNAVPTAAAPSTQVRSEVKDAASPALGYNNQAGAGIVQPEGLPAPDGVASIRARPAPAAASLEVKIVSHDKFATIDEVQAYAKSQGIKCNIYALNWLESGKSIIHNGNAYCGLTLKFVATQDFTTANTNYFANDIYLPPRELCHIDPTSKFFGNVHYSGEVSEF